LEILINTDSTSDQNILGGVLGRIGKLGIGVVNIGDIMGLYKKNGWDWENVYGLA
jgi:hypothetical protein